MDDRLLRCRNNVGLVFLSKTAHSIQCLHPDSISLWEMEVHNLHKWMQDNYGEEPNMVNIIRNNLLEWKTAL